MALCALGAAVAAAAAAAASAAAAANERNVLTKLQQKAILMQHILCVMRNCRCCFCYCCCSPLFALPLLSLLLYSQCLPPLAPLANFAAFTSEAKAK